MDGVDLDESLVRSLLRERHPDLAELTLREVDGGWGNRMWRLGDDLAVRLPRTPSSPALLRAEQRWLPVVAQGLPLPVPVPVRVGEPTERFPWSWTVVRWVDGEPADRVPVSSPGSAGLLAGFLRALHRPAPPDAPVSGRRVSRKANFDEWFAEVADSPVAPAARRAWEQAVAAPRWEGAPVWLHADLHPANVVVSGGTLSGVIDFGDLGAGDPAIDLSAAWILLPAGSADPFFAAYGDPGEAMISRARGWAVLRALTLIAIGRAGDRGLPGGKPTWRPAGWATLERALAY